MIGNRLPLTLWRGCGRACRSSSPMVIGIITFIFGASSALADKHVQIDAQVAFTADDNVTRAAQDGSIRNDQFLSGALGVGYKKQMAPHHRLLLRAFAQGEAYKDYEGLSNLGGGVGATWQYRPSALLLAPTWGLFGRYTKLDYESWRRDADIFTGGLSVNKALTDRVNFAAVVSSITRDSNSAVFDTRETSLLFNLDYRLSTRFTPYVTYNYLNGDIVSSGAQWLLAINNATVTPEPDDVFPDLIAYRLDGQTHVGTLGLNINVNEHHSFDLSARAVRSKADDADITYTRASGTLAYLIRF